jgi:cytoskeleton protein RodZ
MAGLGAYLSHLREEHGPSIEELARATRVAPRFIEALEREDFEVLPAPVFTKGYIRAYCQALGVPADEALARYRDSAHIPVPVTPVPVSAARSSDDGRRTRGTLLLSFALLVGFGVALFAVTLFLQAGRPEIGARPAAPPAPKNSEIKTAATPPSAEPPAKPPEPPAAPEVPAATATPPAAPVAATPSPVAAPVPPAPTPAAPAPTAQKPAPTPAASPTADAAHTVVVADPPPLKLGGVVSPYRLVARTLESTWLRVRTDDGRATEETIPAGEVREWISNRPFIVTVGNAAGVTLELNGQKLPPLGARGAVISRLILPPAEP